MPIPHAADDLLTGSLATGHVTLTPRAVAALRPRVQPHTGDPLRVEEPSSLSSAATLLLAGCGTDDSGSDAGAPAASPIAGDENAAASLVFWSWAENIQRVVDLWNKKNPTQKVTLSGQAASDELIAKFLTAVKAGNAPDVLQAEYQSLPTLITNNALQDLSNVIAPVKSAFPEGTWNLTSFGGATYAVPADVGPMMLFYRADLFEELGLGAEDLGGVRRARRDGKEEGRQALPDHVLSRRRRAGWPGSPSRPGPTGGQREEAWKVAIDDPATRKVLSFWGGLVDSGAVLGDPMYTPQWNSHERRHHHRLAQRGLGRRRPGGRRPLQQGQVEDGPAAAVERGRGRHRLLGRLVHRRERDLQAEAAGGEVRQMDEHRPRGR